jgi:hypothetical protein
LPHALAIARVDRGGRDVDDELSLVEEEELLLEEFVEELLLDETEDVEDEVEVLDDVEEDCVELDDVEDELSVDVELEEELVEEEEELVEEEEELVEEEVVPPSDSTAHTQNLTAVPKVAE